MKLAIKRESEEIDSGIFKSMVKDVEFSDLTPEEMAILDTNLFTLVMDYVADFPKECH